MKDLITIQDEDLVEALKCPLRVGGSVERHSRAFETGLKTLTWLLLRRQEGERVPTAVIREKYTAYWKSAYYPEYENKPASPQDKAFWEGPRRARIIAKRLTDLLRKFTPITVNYSYCINLPSGNRIVGLLHVGVKHKTGQQVVLIPVEFASRFAAHPDAVRMAQWLWTQEVSGLAPMTYTFPFFRGRPRLDKSMTKELVKIQLDSMVNSFAGLPIAKLYPVPGSHCQSCVSKPCMRVYE